jgi:hypothetical protein
MSGEMLRHKFCPLSGNSGQNRNSERPPLGGLSFWPLAHVRYWHLADNLTEFLTVTGPKIDQVKDHQESVVEAQLAH